MFNFHKERINKKIRLGKGAFQVVYAYQKDQNDLNDKKWAVKKIVAQEAKELITVFQEIVLGFSSQNPYVLPVKGYHISHNNETGNWEIYIKIPRMSKSLSTVILEHKKSQGLIPEEQIIKYLYAITQGLSYLQSRGIAHRHIKTENILLSEDEQNIKIGDFGWGFYYGGQASQHPAKQAGSLLYTAPENLQTDLRSLGMVVFELCTCTFLELRSIDFSKKGKEREEDMQNHINKLEGKYSETLLKLMIKLLCFGPDDRPSLPEVCRMLEEVSKGNAEIEILKRKEEEKRIKDLGPEFKMKIKQMEEEIIAQEKMIAELKETCELLKHKLEEAGNIREKELAEMLKEKEKMEKGIQTVIFNQSKEVEKKEREIYYETENMKLSYKTGGMEVIVKNEGSRNKTIDELMREITEKACEIEETNIKSFNLNLYGCSNITNEGAKAIASSIEKLSTLQHLNLNLY